MGKPKYINFIYNTSGLLIIQVYIASGSIYEELYSQKKKQNGVRGISHFLEHLLFKDTQTYTGKQLLEAFTSLGSYYNASTDKDETIFYVKTLVDNYKLATDVIYDIVCQPVFRESDMNAERKVVLEEFAQVQDNFEDYIYEEGMKTILKDDNPYLQPVIGTHADLKRITLCDVKEYYAEHFTKSRMMVLVNCDLSMKSIITQYVNDKFRPFFTFTRSKAFAVNEKDIQMLSRSLQQQTVRVVHNNTYQYTTVVLFPSFKFADTKNNIILNFIRYCLTGSGLYSILYEELREKRGLVYGIKMSNEHLRYLGITRLTFSTSNRDTANILKVVFDILIDLCENGLNKKSLKYFKTSFVNHYAYKFTNEEHRSSWYGDNLFHGSTLSESEMIDQIQGLSNEDVKTVARKVFDLTQLSVYSIGKYGDKEEKETRNAILSVIYSYASHKLC